MLLLLARLGLRGGEVLALTLDDLDWERGEMLVRGKGQRCERDYHCRRMWGPPWCTICGMFVLLVRHARSLYACTRRNTPCA